MFERDNYAFTVSTKEDALAEKRFADFLAEVQESTERIENVPLNTLTFVTSAIAPDSWSDELKDTVNNGTKMFISTPDMPLTGIRDVGMGSVLQRIGIMPFAVENMPKSQQVEIFNKIKACNQKDEVLIYLVAGKVNALLSDGDSKTSYRVFPQDALFSQLRGVAEEINNSANIADFVGEWTFADMACRWIVDKHLAVGGRDYATAIQVHTGEVGNSSVQMSAALWNEESHILVPLMTPFIIEHKKKNSQLDVLNAGNMLSSAAERDTKDLNDLNGIAIKYPENTALHLAHNIGMPKKLSIDGITEFFNLNPDAIEGMTALGIYMLLAGIYNRYAAKTPSASNRLKMQGNLLKAKRASWSLYDHPMLYAWDMEAK